MRSAPANSETVPSRPDLPPDTRSSLDEVASSLREGSLVVLPVETGYVVAGNAARPDTMDRLRTLAAASAALGAVEAPVWLAPSVEDAERALAAAGSVHRRVLRRLLPGPAILKLEPSGQAVPTFEGAVGGTPGAFRDGTGAVHLRVAGRSKAAAVVSRAGVPIACVEVLDASGNGPREGTEAARIALATGAAPIVHTVEDGAPPVRQRPTVIGLAPPGTPGGPVQVRRGGAYEERFIKKHLGMNVLFVCTGNTCRSPMAEAIASGLAKSGSGGGDAADPEMRFSSAGVAASGGSPATPEAAEAVKELGFTLARHASRPLTRRMIAEADVIYTMGRSHREAVLDLDPTAAGKVHTLDPEGSDIPDPVGMDQRVYTRTSLRLRDLIAGRLKELRS